MIELKGGSFPIPDLFWNRFGGSGGCSKMYRSLYHILEEKAATGAKHKRANLFRKIHAEDPRVISNVADISEWILDGIAGVSLYRNPFTDL